MIRAIRDIGAYYLDKEGVKIDINNPKTILPYLIEYPFLNTKENVEKRVLFICFDNNKYVKIDDEKLEKTKLLKYLYKTKGGNTPPISPTVKLSANDVKIKRIKDFFEYELKNYRELADSDKSMFEEILKNLNDNYDTIEGDIRNKNLSNKEKYLLTIKVDGKYVGDFDVFSNILLKNIAKDFFSTEKFKAKSSDKFCSICHYKKPEIYGLVRTYKFYTVDKEGFVSGFNRSNGWKMYPVCKECAFLLEIGKKFIDENLSFYFYGNYKLIPKFLGDFKTRITDFLKKFEDPSFKQEVINVYKNEDLIYKILAKESNYLTYNLLFYNPSATQQFEILKLIEEVLPSRFSQIFEAKNRVDNIKLFRETIIKNKVINFNFSIIKNLHTRQAGNKLVFDRNGFLDSIDNIFSGKPMDYYHLLHRIVDKIQSQFRKSEKKYTLITSFEGFILLCFLNELRLLNNFGRRSAKMVEEKITNKSYEDFFNENKDFFDGNEKKAIFLLGILTQNLLRIQRKKLGSPTPPFYSKLKGLKLNKNDIIRLLPQIKDKLISYKAEYKSLNELQDIISGLLIRGGKDWEVNNDEISFYFTIGMNCAYRFVKNKEEGGTD